MNSLASLNTRITSYDVIRVNAITDPVMAFMLLASSGLLESDVSAFEKALYDNMKNVLKHVFISGITTSPSSSFNTLKTEVKVELDIHSNSEATSASDSVFTIHVARKPTIPRKTFLQQRLF